MLHSNIIDRLGPELFIPDLKAQTKEAAIDELLAAMAANGYISTLEKHLYYKLFLKREEQGSTYLGNFLATPHIRLDDFSEILFAGGISKAGIPFGEGQSAHLILTILCSNQRNDIYLNFLSFIASSFKNPDSITQILKMKSAQEFYSFFTGKKNGKKKGNGA